MLDDARRLVPICLVGLALAATACGGRSEPAGAEVRVESLGQAPGELGAIDATFSEVQWNVATRTLDVTLYNAPLSRCHSLVAGGRVLPESNRVELFYAAATEETSCWDLSKSKGVIHLTLTDSVSALSAHATIDVSISRDGFDPNMIATAGLIVDTRADYVRRIARIARTVAAAGGVRLEGDSRELGACAALTVQQTQSAPDTQGASRSFVLPFIEGTPSASGCEAPLRAAPSVTVAAANPTTPYFVLSRDADRFVVRPLQ